jgi:hypothetical protein
VKLVLRDDWSLERSVPGAICPWHDSSLGYLLPEFMVHISKKLNLIHYTYRTGTVLHGRDPELYQEHYKILDPDLQFCGSAFIFLSWIRILIRIETKSWIRIRIRIETNAEME